MADDIHKVTDPADPRRCQANGTQGQCPCISVPGKTFCKMHGGAAGIDEAGARNYRLTRYKAEVQRMTESSQIKSLREELGILRLIMETHLNQCQSDTDLILKSQQIGDLAMKIEKMVSSCNKLDTHLGQVLDKQALLNFASEIINIVSEEVPDMAVVDAIAGRITSSLSGEKDV